ncbi:MAG TPA: hypothetical protein VMH90_06870 [Thermoplasmata archaeon]|nr:hypothetical protein [Thermoplasmata archaeon]
MEPQPAGDLEESLLLHLLEHRGHQVRFEADQWTTEFGIFRAFGDTDQGTVKNALRSLEMSRTIYRRVQYVIGYSEPKLVYSLTPSGHRKALTLRRRAQGLPEIVDDHPSYAAAPEDPNTAPDTTSLPPIRD